MIPNQSASVQVPPAMPVSATQASQQLQLHDIHLPEQVSSFPYAIGWWLLVALIVISALWLIKKINRNKALNQSRNHALAVLEKQKTQSNIELISLVKWSAMQYFNRQYIASLYGDNFRDFLIAQLPEKHQQTFETLSKQAFINQYQSATMQENDTESMVNSDCKNAVKLWLTYALPPKGKIANKGDLTHD